MILTAIAKLTCPKSVSNWPRIGTDGINNGPAIVASKSPAALKINQILQMEFNFIYKYMQYT